MKKNMNRLLLMVLLLCAYGMATAQISAGKITGTVTSDKDNEPLAGVSILVKGTTLSTITDMNGVFSIKANPGQTLVLSYIGFATLQVPVTGNKLIINMKETENTLDELVVIGYGTMKKKLNTGATVQVKGDDLMRQNTTNPLQALQGSTPGVQITSSSGQPGKGANVIIRGVGSIYGVSPTYIVDGVITGDISYLNSADIASIDILKDAASCAIYGAQASNGIILVTTRTGTKGKAQLHFDGYYGVQNISNNIKTLNASDYALIMNEQAVNSGKPRIYTDKAAFLSKYGNTDWMDAITAKNAPMYDYNLGVNGGSDLQTYSVSLGMTGQDGVIGGHDLSSFQRISFRSNNEYSLYNNLLKFGHHLAYTNTSNTGVNEGGIYSGSPIRGALTTSPFLPVYDDAGNFFDNTNPNLTYAGTRYNGNIWSCWNEGESNPLAAMSETESHSVSQKLFGDVYAEFQPMKGLKVKTVFGWDAYWNNSRSFTPVYHLSKYTYNSNDFATQSMSIGGTWSWDNTVSYDLKVKDHALTFLAGSSIREFQGEWMYTKNADLTIADWDHAWIRNAKNTANSTLWAFDGAPNDESKMLSYFGRINYNYLEKYLFNATFRADGSSRFAKGNQWGYFPSFSAGWVVTNEDFMSTVPEVDFLKVRATWGQVGNQNITAYQYLATISSDNCYYYYGSGVPAGSLMAPGSEVNVYGSFPKQMANDKLKWETSEQSGIGFDARFLQSKLGVNFDLYNKLTKDWLIKAPILATAGAEAPYMNGGDVTNSGVELALSWNDRINDFVYQVGGNISYNKNHVNNVPTSDGIIYGNTNEAYANADAFYRVAMEGYPIGMFWGWKTDGILQNDAEVADYVASLNGSKNNSLQKSNLAPGDVRFVDVTKDGKINESDKTMIGSPWPDITFGMNLSCQWKGFDASIVASGVAGNEIFQCYRDYGGKQSNYTTTAMAGRWYGEGTSNFLPRNTEANINYRISDLFIRKGDYLRISNIQIGYDFSKIIKLKYLSQLRWYVGAQNAFTLTAYDGMDPEIGYGPNAATSGADMAYYPRARTFLTGVNIKF